MKNIVGMALAAAFGLASTTAWAQPTSGQLSKEKMMQIGDERTGQKDTYTALEWYTKAYEKDPNDVVAIYKVASTHDMLRDYKAAEEWYNKLAVADKKGEYPLVRFWYGMALKYNGKYDEAVLQFQDVEKNYNGNDADYYKKRAKLEIEGARWAKANPDPKEAADVTNVGKSINSPSSEGSTMPYGRTKLFFSALRSDSVITIDDKQEHKHGHIYVSTRSDDQGPWEDAKIFTTTIEKKGFHAVHPAFTPSGDFFYFTRAQLEGNFLSNSRIMVCQANGDVIGEPRQLDFNSAAYSCKDPRVAQIDGKLYLFFSSNMPGNSQGGWDIWVAEIKEDGSTYQPINLGPSVNTFMDEITPYFDRREKILYFASNGHPSMGGFDVFRSKKGGSVSDWGAAENMGAGFNSRVDDFGFVINDDGGDDDCYGYVTSNRPGTMSLKSETCCDDIFAILMSDRCDIICNIDVYDETTKKELVGSTVQVVDKATGKVVDEQTNKDNNKYRFVLERNKQYEIRSNKEGFESTTKVAVGTSVADIGAVTKPVQISKQTYLREMGLVVETYDRKNNSPLSGVTVVVYDAKSDKEVTRFTQNSGNRFTFVVPRDRDYKIVAELKDYNGDQKTVAITELSKLQKLMLDKPEMGFQLVDILFDFDKANLRADAVKTLDELIALLQKNPTWVVEVSGHTDAKGANKYNERLAERRTKAALAYIKSKGIDEKRLIPAAFGEEKPKADNEKDGKDNPDGRQINRRVEFKIVDGDPNAKGKSSVSPTLTPGTTSEKKNKVEEKTAGSTTGSTSTGSTTTVTEAVKDTRKPTTADFSIKKGTNLGQVKFGTSKEYSVEITNTGKENLYLDFVQGSCECTVPLDYPKKGLAPGQKGTIKFRFDSNKASVQNGYNSGLEIYGNVKDGMIIWDFTVDVLK